MSSFNWFERTSGNLILVPLRGEDASTLGVEILPVGCATPFENTAPAVVVYNPIAHEVEVTVTLLWSCISGVHQWSPKHHVYQNRSRDVHGRIKEAP